MKAVVLSGGGSKGSYQIGVWKALKKLNIKYDIVTGTSVGALNGALMVQKSYFKAIRLWKKINMRLLFGESATKSTKDKDVIKMYGKNFLKNGGMEVEKLQCLIDNYINKDKFFNSNIDFGLVTVNVSGKKAIQLKKNKIPRDKLADYLMASASCYPAFQAKDINGCKFVDGGVVDNLPINLALSLGADEIIAVDLCAPGIKRNVKEKIKTITIKPNNKLTNFLNFNEEGSIKNIKFGYNDTMKVFNKYVGNKYTFKKRGFNNLLDEHSEIFIHNFNKILNTEKLVTLFKLDTLNINSLLLKCSEDLGKLFNFDETKIYNYKKYNKDLLKKANKLIYSEKKITKKKQIVTNLYAKMKKKDYKYLRIKGILTPKEFILALYLYTLSEV